MRRSSHTILFLLALAVPSAAQVVAVERPNGRLNLLELRESTAATASTVMTNVHLLPLDLVGQADKDRLRLNLPRPSADSQLPSFVRLPGGGSIWRAVESGADTLISVTPTGELRVLLRVEHTEGRLRDQVAVSPSGQRVLATNGSRAWAINTAGSTPATSITGATASLDIDPDSLRINDLCAYFLSDGDLFVSDGFGLARPISLPLIGEEELVEETVLASQSKALLAVLEVEEHLRRLVAVHPSGSVEILTPTPGRLPLPGLEEELGPFIAVSADGQRFAWRTEGVSEELFVTCSGSQPRHITVEPDYPVYLDNIGVISFGTSNRLCFFAGDRVISGITGAEQIGAADMYAIVFDPQCGITSRNVSGTSGSLSPPFTLPGTMTLEEAVVDPLGQRFLVTEEPLSDEERLSTFTINAAAGTPGFGTGQLANGHEDFEFIAVGTSVILATERELGHNEERFLSLIPPLSALGSQSLPFGSWSQDAEIIQVEHSGTSGYVCVQDQGQLEHHWIDLTTGELFPILPRTAGFGVGTGATPQASALLPGATFDHMGRLLIGLQRPSGRVQWLRVERPARPSATGLRTRPGFPLPY